MPISANLHFMIIAINPDFLDRKELLKQSVKTRAKPYQLTCEILTIRVIRVIMILSGGKSAMPMTQKEMVKLLAANGWIKTKGGKGSHIKMEKRGERPITVPHGELNKYTERGIRKQAGI